MNEQYLWDRSGEPDYEVIELEQLMAPMRMAERRPDFAQITRLSPRQNRLAGWKRWALPVAVAASAIIASVLWITFRPHLHPGVWEAGSATGTPELAGKAFTGGRIEAGAWLSTDSTSSIHLRTTIGEMEIRPGSQLSLAESRAHRQRFVMRYGSIHARISAPPGLFVVDTPSARAIDLGCEYTLRVEHDGSGELAVSAGWVELQHSWMQSLVPAGNAARISPDGTLTAPYFQDATPAFKEAVTKLSLNNQFDPETRRSFTETILREARQRDAFTLLNLFIRTNAEERVRIFDRLNQFVPAPPGITRETARNWRMNSMDAWWPVVEKAVGLSEIRKGKKSLRDLDLGEELHSQSD